MFFFVTRIAATIACQLVNFLPVVIFSPTEFGEYSVLLATANLMFTMTYTWHSAVATDKGQLEFISTGNIQNTLNIRLAFLLISISVCLVIVSMTHDSRDFVLIVMLSLSLIMHDFGSSMLHVVQKDQMQVSIAVVVALVRAVSILLFVDDVFSLCFILLSIDGISSLFVFLYLIHKKIYQCTLKWPTWNFDISWLKAQFVSALAVFINNWFFYFILGRGVLSYAEIGQFGFQFRYVMAITLIFIPFNILCARHMYQSNSSRTKLLDSLSRYLVHFVCTVSLLYVGAWLLLYFISPKFGYNTDLVNTISLLLFPYFLLYCLSNYVGPVLLNSEHFEYLRIALVAQAGLNLLSLISVPTFGVVGLVCTMIVAVLVKCVICYVGFNRLRRASCIVGEHFRPSI